MAASVGTASLKNSTSATAGSWFGHADTLDTIPNGTTASMVVFVWDTSVSADPRVAAAQYGHSAIFQYTPPTNPLAMPSDFLMNNFAAFELDSCSPEPSSLALVASAAFLFLCLWWIKDKL